MSDREKRERVAVIGSGVAGLSAAWLLAKQGKQVTLLESEDRCGGHALTVESPEGPVDLGFQVCNLTTYPHLMGFFRELGVGTECSDMSFALSTPEVEWGSRGLSAVFAQPGLTRSPRFLRMIYEVTAFGRQAPEVLRDARWAETSLGEYLKARRYSEFFTTHYIGPMCAAIWSCSEADALDFPVVSMVRFWVNHHLLDLIERPVWRVLKGRSQAYVDAAVAQLRAMGGEVRTGARVQSVARKASGGVAVEVAGRRGAELFDHVVLATHSDVSLALLGNGARPDEAAALAAIRYQSNEVVLHSDPALMPRQREVWASWNCVQPAARVGEGSVCVSYWVNLLQNLPEGARDLFVTLNPHTEPEPAAVVRRLRLAHPLFNKRALEAQAALTGDLQGEGGVWFAGAWCGYGFHEDGIRSAVRVAERLCATPDVTPWEPVSCPARLPLSARPWLELFCKFGGAMLAPKSAVRLVLPNGSERTLGDSAAKPADTATLHVRDAALFQRVVLRSDIGLGEAYMDGAFYADDLLKLIDVLSRASCAADAKQATQGALGLLPGLLHSVSERLELTKHKRNSNTKAGSAANIAYHYDAGNDFYKLFLDESMMYSSGVHAGLYASIEGLSFEAQERKLEEAQMAKLDAMIARAELQPGERVLEIGCGWGAFAMRMAQRAGVHVTGITVSREQLAEARKRVAAAGLEQQVAIEFCDYRDVQGQYDKVVSIEMIEAVGHEHLPSYFEVVARALKPGGLAAIQVITLPDARYEDYCSSHSDFIRTYIFPGGHCPSLCCMNGLASQLGLELHGCVNIGDDYAVTLRLWRERMMARKAQVKALGYPERFLRMYEFYFCYCEAGFANGLIHDYQIAWRKSAHAPAAPHAAPGAAEPARNDPLTGALLLLWCGLLGLLCRASPHMASIPATVVVTVALRLGLGTLLGLPRAKVETLAAHAMELSASLASAAWLVTAAVSLDELSPASFARLLLDPATPPPPSLALGARALVGTAAGFSALQAWARVRSPKRGFWEVAAYTVALVCQSAALFYGKYLAALSAAQLCEAHSALLRLRSLRLLNQRAPGGALWAAAWLAFGLFRVLPHGLLLALFALERARVHPADLYAWGMATAGLAFLSVHNLATGVQMAHAHIADRAAADIANVQHRKTAAAAAPQERQPFEPLPAALAVCVAAAVVRLSLVQEPACLQLVLATSASYGAAYALLRATGWLQPAPGTLTAAEAAEWRSRLFSVANGVLITVGSLLCFSEWPYPGAEGWISAHHWSHPVTFASLFVGYLQWDLCWCVWHVRATKDYVSIVHHALFIAITHYVLWGWYFKVPFAWLSLAELSTPFLNLRWFLAVRGRKAGGLYLGVSYAFAISFILTRVLGYGLGLAHLWSQRALWLPAQRGLYLTIAGCHAGFVLNLYWSLAVVGALARATRGAKPKAD